jgi:rfaE bifunctional protein kinase chain/domain
MDKERFDQIVRSFSKVKVAVLGDFFLDLYIQMDRTLSELSLETHKEAFQAIDLRGQPGAAGVVTNNLVALGAETAAISFIGHDGNGYTLKNALENKGVNTEYLIETEKRVTPTYTKPLMLEVDKQNIELNRIDIINRSPTPEQINLALLKKVRKAVSSYNGILVLEQVNQDGYGVMSPLLRNGLGEMASEYPEKIIMVDSRHFAARYFSVSLKMNLSEAANTAGNLNPEFVDIDQEDQISAADKVANLFWEKNHRPAFITLGENGLCGCAANGFFHYSAFQIEGPIDIVGAGDSVLAGIGLALCAGAAPEEAAFIGNLVGSITVQQIGTTGIATQEDLDRRYQEYLIQQMGQE